MKDGRLHVVAWGFFGIGNIGNEGTLAGCLAYLREHHPDVGVTCLAVDPVVTEREHDIPARQLMTFRADPARHGLLLNGIKAASRVWDVPRTLALMRGVDVLVVPGTGILETELIPSPWGLAYWLFLAALSCRLHGGRVVLASVGAHPPQHPVTRQLYRWILRLSDYHSFRDQRSADAMRALDDSREAPVVPDLTFALPTPAPVPVRPGHVVVGVMSYDGTSPDPADQAAVRERYREGITRLVLHLVDAQRTVTLLTGDVHDQAVAGTVAAAVRHARPELGHEALGVSSANSLEEIMAEIAPAEVAVASRFHNLICALKLAKPTVSLSYAAKNADLLAEFELEEFSQPVDGFDVALLIEQVAEVVRRHPSRKERMLATLERSTAAVQQQYRRLSDEFFTSRSRP